MGAAGDGERAAIGSVPSGVPSGVPSSVPSRDKAAARSRARAHRTELRNNLHVFPSSQLRSSDLLGLPGLGGRPIRRIAAYSSYGTEPDTATLIEDLLGEGLEVLLPRIEGENLAWVAVSPETDYDINARGIREPRGPDRGLAGVDVVLVPALGVTRAGDRLGQGAGFYDRALVELPRANEGGPLLIAVIYAHERHNEPTWPVEAHDIRMDDVITVDWGRV